MSEFIAGFLMALVFAVFAGVAAHDIGEHTVKVGVCEQMGAEYEKSVGCVKGNTIVYRFKD